MNGIQKLNLIRELSDVDLHPPLGLVERVGVDGDQLFQLSFLFLLQPQSEFELLLKCSEMSC